jgi:hypothetical protein
MRVHPNGEMLIFTDSCDEVSVNEMLTVMESHGTTYVLTKETGSIIKLSVSDVHSRTIRYRVLPPHKKFIYDATGILQIDNHNE